MSVSLFLAIFLGVLCAGLVLRYWPKVEAWSKRRRDRIKDERFIARAAAARRGALIREHYAEAGEAPLAPIPRAYILVPLVALTASPLVLFAIVSLAN